MKYTVRLLIVDENGVERFCGYLAPATAETLIGDGRKAFSLIGTMQYVAGALRMVKRWSADR